MKNLFIFLIGAVVLMFFGCAPQVETLLEGQKLCECKEDFKFPDMIHIADSFYIRGDCEIEIPQENIKESYGLKMFYQPPSFMYIQGDHLLLGKAIIAGGNVDDFWLWIRHNEVDAYWYGGWDHGCMDNSVSIALNPSIILEAMGLLYCRQDYKRYGCSCNAYVFNRFLTDGSEKRLWFDCCKEKLRKIEIFDSSGRMILLCKIKRYLDMAEGYQLPGLLEIQIYSESNLAGKATIEFNSDSYKIREFGDKFHERFFSRPEPKGAKHIYKMLSDGNFIKVSGE